MEIFKFCEIAQIKNLKEKMHWAVFLADRLQSRQTDFMHIFNFFQIFSVLSILKNWSCTIKA